MTWPSVLMLTLVHFVLLCLNICISGQIEHLMGSILYATNMLNWVFDWTYFHLHFYNTCMKCTANILNTINVYFVADGIEFFFIIFYSAQQDDWLRSSRFSLDFFFSLCSFTIVTFYHVLYYVANGLNLLNWWNWLVELVENEARFFV